MANLINNNIVNIFTTSEEMFVSASKDFTERARASVDAKGEFSVVLSGGNTPKQFFDVLTTDNFKGQIPWSKIKFFFGDERYVPSEDKRSNYHMAYKYLFSKVPVLSENIFRVPTDFKDPVDAASAYELTLRESFKLQDNEYPKFDLLYLGLGEDGHTASLMPISHLVNEYIQQSKLIKSSRLVGSLWFETEKMFRITLTPAAINHAASIIFLVEGKNKDIAVREVLEGIPDPLKYPAELIHCVNSENIWFIDSAAAKFLENRTN